MPNQEIDIFPEEKCQMCFLTSNLKLKSKGDAQVNILSHYSPHLDTNAVFL